VILWTLNLDGPQAQPSTALLLHFDGANGSTTFTDSSIFARAMTVNNVATISTAQSRFGGASGHFGSQAWISTPADAIALPGDFTFEGFVWFADGARCFFFGAGTAGSSIRFERDSGGFLEFAYGSTALASSTQPANSTWHHVAVTREGSTLRMFLNGVLQGAQTTSEGARAADVFHFGSAPNASSLRLNGFLDEWRIVTGQAVYTANFTPPTAPFPDPGGINGQGTNTVGAFVQVGQGSVGSAAVTGFGAATLSSFEQVAVGTALVAGGGAAALSAFTQSAAGTVRASGAGANTLGVFTQAGAGLVSGGAVVGSGANTLGVFSQAAAGAVRVSASGANTLGAFSQSATAGVRIQGASARTLGAFTQSASGTVALPAIQGAGASAMGAFSSVGAGALWVSGVGSTGLNGFSTESQGELRVAGAGVSVLSAFVSQGGAMTYAPQGGEPTGVVLVPAHAVSMRVQGHAQPMSQGKHAVTANR
jgi:hypothetical protein